MALSARNVAWLATVFLLTPFASAHPISLSSATVDVREDRIAVEIQVMLEDLVLYQALQAGKEHRFDADDLTQAADKHREFVLKFFAIRDATGNQLDARVIRVDKSQITAGGVAQSELMANWVVYHLQFAVEAPQPFLTFLQTFGGSQAVLPAVMDLMLLQNGILLQRPLQLSHSQPHTAKFDWEHPPTESPKGLAGLRKQFQQQRRARLGISSYGGLYSFIYVTRHEVRHEILVPLLTLERWLPIDRKDPEFLEVGEQEAAREKIAAFFRDRNPVEINGKVVQAELIRMNFFGLNINDFALRAKPRRVSIYQARLGVILAYRPNERPRELRLRWETFNEFAPFLRSIVLVGDDDPAEHFFRPQESIFQWTADDARRPTEVHQVKGTSARIGEPASGKIVLQLLQNAYRAFDFQTDGDVYDALATSVTGDLLRELYLQIKRSLLMAEQGGAVSHVEKVTLVSSQRLKVSESEFQTRCRWRVTGTVEHWGHVHTRENQYEAQFTIQCADGAFKIREMEVLGEERVRFETSLRGDNQD